jgi:hypothetical protein
MTHAEAIKENRRSAEATAIASKAGAVGWFVGEPGPPK